MFICFIVGFVVVFGISYALKKPAQLYSGYWEAQAYERARAGVAAQEALSRADTFGGSTPEETFSMFLDALKAGDMDLAVKYFEIDKRVEWSNYFKQLVDNGSLSDSINALYEAQRNWNILPYENLNYKIYQYTRTENNPFSLDLPDGRGGFIHQEFPAGEYKNEIAFIKNHYSNIWKISHL